MVANTSSRLARPFRSRCARASMTRSRRLRSRAARPSPGRPRAPRASRRACQGAAGARLELAHQRRAARRPRARRNGRGAGCARRPRANGTAAGDVASWRRYNSAQHRIARGLPHQGLTANRSPPGDGRRGLPPRRLRRAGALAALRRAAPRRPLPRHHRLVHRAGLGHGGDGARAARRLGRACGPCSSLEGFAHRRPPRRARRSRSSAPR